MQILPLLITGAGLKVQSQTFTLPLSGMTCMEIPPPVLSQYFMTAMTLKSLSRLLTDIGAPTISLPMDHVPLCLLDFLFMIQALLTSFLWSLTMGITVHTYWEEGSATTILITTLIGRHGVDLNAGRSLLIFTSGMLAIWTISLWSQETGYKMDMTVDPLHVHFFKRSSRMVWKRHGSSCPQYP